MMQNHRALKYDRVPAFEIAMITLGIKPGDFAKKCAVSPIFVRLCLRGLRKSKRVNDAIDQLIIQANPKLRDLYLSLRCPGKPGRPRKTIKEFKRVNVFQIKTEIEKQKISVTQFAKKCRISNSVIHRILSGSFYSPRVCELMREKLGMDESDFYLPGNQVDTLAQYNRLRKFGFAVEPPAPTTQSTPEVTP